MIQCYHDSCDDLAHVTDDMITFLGKTVDSLVKTAEELTNEHCEMKDKICGEEVTAEAGSIHSPYFPAKYPNSVFCEWTIKTPRDDMAINLSFDKLQLEGSSDNCSRDFLEVWYRGQKPSCLKPCPKHYDPVCGTDGKTYSNKCMMEMLVCEQGSDVTIKHRGECQWFDRRGSSHDSQDRFCGSDLPQDIKSRGSTVTIVFRSDQLQAFSGFKVSWSTVPVPTAAGESTVPVPTAAGPRHCLDGVVMLIGVFLITWLSFSRQFV